MLRPPHIPFALLLGLLAPSATIAQGTCVLSADFAGGIPAGWDIGAQVEQQDDLGNGLGTFVDAWTVGTSAEANAHGWFPVPDVPGGNTFAMVNDDAAPCNCALGDVALTSPAFDLSAAQGTVVRLRAFNNGAFGGGDGTVEASADGINWNPVATIGAVLYTWQWVQADLSAFDGEALVQVRFRWSDNGNWAGGFAVDDICVTTRAAHDLVLLEAFLSDAEATAFDPTRRTLGYTQLPLEQAGALTVKAVVVNAGSLAALNVTCTADVLLDGTAQGSFSTTVPVIGAGDRDTLTILTGWTPPAIGELEVVITVGALSTDDEPWDNSAARGLWITGPGFNAGNHGMALDDSTVTGAIANQGNDYAVAVRYEIGAAGSSAHAVGFLPGDGSFANGRVVGKLLDAQFNLLASSTEHVLTQTEIDDAASQRRMVYLIFDSPLALDADADVYAVIEHESDSGAVTVALSGAAVMGSALLYDGPGIDWDYLLNVPVVRLYLSGPEVGLPETAASSNGLHISPNPSSDLAWVKVDAPMGSAVQWTLHDLQGATVLTGSATTPRFGIPLSALAAGTYLIRTRCADAVNIGRLVVAR